MTDVTVTKQFVDALKMMNNINQSLIIPEDSEVVASKATSENRIAYTNIGVKVPRKFCIYDLREFIRILAVVDKPVLDFSNARYVMINSGNGDTSIKYSDGDEFMIDSQVTRAIQMPSIDYTIEVTLESIKSALNAANVMRLDKIGFNADGQNVYVVARKEISGNSSDDSSDGSLVSSSYSNKIGDTSDKYDAIFDQSDLQLIDSDCTIEMCKQNLAKLSFGPHTIYVGLDTDSQMD